MKRSLCCLLLLVAPFVLQAQDYALSRNASPLTFDSAAKLVLNRLISSYPSDTGEGGEVNEFRRWADFCGRLVSYDAPQDSSLLKPAEKAQWYYLNNQDLYCVNDPQAYTGDWSCIGPFNDYYGIYERAGRIDAIWVDSDMATMLAGADAGGLWKSTDTGHSWHNISDPTANNGSIIPGTMGVKQLAVNPTDHDIIYVGLNMEGTTSKTGAYAMGLAYTTDGGAHWLADTNFLTVNAQTVADFSYKFVTKLAYMPGTEKLYAISNDKVLYKASQASNWVEIGPSLSAGEVFTDMEFSILNPGKVIVSTTALNDSLSLWVYNGSWTRLGMPAPAGHFLRDGIEGIKDISISGNDTVYYLSTAAYDTVINTVHYTAVRPYLHKTPISAANPIYINRGAPIAGIQYIVVSPANNQIIYGTRHDGYTSFYQSTDEGLNFASIASTHADARTINLYTATTSTGGINDVLYGGSDGGVVMKKAGNSNFESITGSGLAINQFYSMSNTDADDEYVTAGAQDNGGFAYVRNRAEPWSHHVGGDNFLTKFVNNGVLQSFIEPNPDTNAVGTNNLFSIAFSGNVSSSDNVPFPPDYPNPNCIYCSANNLQKPMYFDTDTNLFIGSRLVWTKHFNTGTWATAFAADPKDSDKVCDVIMSEPVHDTAYLAYRETSYPYEPTGANDSGKLFISKNAHPLTGLPTWTNITPEQVKWNRINDIETAPDNMSRIWLALGDVNYWLTETIPDSMTQKVYYSDDYGQNWVDISSGLPALAVNKILYRKGGNDMLYVATDVGVFKCDFSQYNPGATNPTTKVNRSVRWTCFNNGLPPVVATDMEFNYCAGKLRIATFGRGVWETPLFPSDDVPGESDEISTNTTWSNSRYVAGSVRVDSGATLTISGSGTIIHMGRNAYIVVEHGAKLIVEDATITNDCENCLWKGILGYGDGNVAQTSTNQPTIILTGATIEHARKGVCNFPESLPGGDYTHSGAIIHAFNTHFLNCCVGACFGPYEHNLDYAVTPTAAYDAYFTSCTFEINDNYRGHNISYPFQAGALMVGVQGVKFEGCDFYNRDNNSQNKGQGYGIRCYDGGCRVQSHCTSITTPCTSWHPCSFTGFGNGIFASGTLNPWYTVSVDGAQFDSCTVGIKTDHFNNMTAVHSTFTIGDGVAPQLFSGSCHQNVGIWNSYSEVFGIEDNTFNGYRYSGQPSGMDLIGVVTEHSAIPTNEQNEAFFPISNFHNEIYRNYFDSLTRACWALGPNGSGVNFGNNGLVYKCNSFVKNDSSIIVTGNPLYDGIAYFQGNDQYSTGNTFSNTSSFHNYMKNTGRGFEYRYYGSMSGSEYPNSLSPSYQIALFTASNDNACDDHYTTIPIDITTRNTLRARLAGLKPIKDSLLAEYTSLVDCGNTAALRAFIDTMTSDSAVVVHDTLLGCSPYLSKEAVLDILSLGILSKPQLQDVLYANPEMLHEPAVIKYIKQYLTGTFSSGDVTVLQDSSVNHTARTDKALAIDKITDSISLCANILITDAKSDSTYGNVDSIIVWLDDLGTEWADYDIVGYYYSRNQTDSGLAVLERIPAKYGFDSLLTIAEADTSHGADLTFTYTQSQEVFNYMGYLWIYQILSRVRGDGRSIDSLTTNEVDSLDLVAALDDYYVKAGHAAKGLLNHANAWVIDCAEAHIIDDDAMVHLPKAGHDSNHDLAGMFANSYKATTNENKESGKPSGTNNMLNVYPNPANEYVTFDYRVSNPTGSLKLMVTDSRGVKVKQFVLGDTFGKVRWETKSVVPGIYFYQLMDETQIINSGKVAIMR